jgi:hypothetical protein
MAFTEFCCRSGGSNLNAGTRTGNSTEPGTSASFTYASGSWVSSTGVFTAASGNPSTDGVAVGDFASVYADGATVTTLVGRVTAVSSTTITVSTTAKSGTTTDGTSNRTLKIGGAWKGPNGTEAFPFGFITNSLQNAGTDNPRVNFKNDATYSVTAAMTHANADIVFQGYSNSYGDTGRATIDGGSSGASYVVLTLSAAGLTICNLIFQNNGATGSATGVVASGTTAFVDKCSFTGFRGAGLSLTSSGTVVQSEAYSCNASNTANLGGFIATANPLVMRNCFAYSNSGSNNNGFYMGGGGGGQFLINCIAHTNGKIGIWFSSNGTYHTCVQCTAYNNTSDGFWFQSNANRSVLLAENCLSVSNGGYGYRIQQDGSLNYAGYLRNCGHYNNTSGGVLNSSADSQVIATGTIALAASPFVNAASGDFRLNTAESKGVGFGSFTQSSGSGSVGYPDLGALEAQASSSGGGSLINSQQLVRQGWIG